MDERTGLGVSPLAFFARLSKKDRSILIDGTAVEDIETLRLVTPVHRLAYVTILK